jgi:hypothetical protein
MAFPVKVDEYSVLSIGGAYNFVSQDTLPQQSFVFQMGNNNTVYPSVKFNFLFKIQFLIF